MGPDMSRYLLDTNILIYYIADAVPSERVYEIEDMVVWQKVTDITFTKLFHIFYSNNFIILKTYFLPCLAIAVTAR